MHDEMAALRECARVLAPGGRIVLRLPAYNWLRGQHDKAVHIRRRYTCGEIATSLRWAGFCVEHLSYANMFLFPIALIKRMAERVWPPHHDRSDLVLDVGPFNGMLKTILSVEAPLVARIRLPLGLTAVAVGRKP